MPEGKPKRTRTGCLTCRERHLKCDETKPTCNNCAKSQRECNWGKKLNFLDTTCEQKAYLIPKGTDYCIAFQDESRIIAAEYVGGREMYPVQGEDTDMDHMPLMGNAFDMAPPAGQAPTAQPLAPLPPARQHLPPIQGMVPDAYPHGQQTYTYDLQRAPQQQQQQQQHSRARKSDTVFFYVHRQSSLYASATHTDGPSLQLF
jgi:hypothetical protein